MFAPGAVARGEDDLSAGARDGTLDRSRFGSVVEDQQPSGILREVLTDGRDHGRLLGGLIPVVEPQSISERIKIGAEGFRTFRSHPQDARVVRSPAPGVLDGQLRFACSAETVRGDLARRGGQCRGPTGRK